jgi:hypothetical protein
LKSKAMISSRIVSACCVVRGGQETAKGRQACRQAVESANVCHQKLRYMGVAWAAPWIVRLSTNRGLEHRPPPKTH